MGLGERIVIARKNKGLTQEQLSDLTNITVRTIQRIEKDESVPRSYTLKTIATALDISLEDPALSKTESEETSITSSSFSREDDAKHFLQVLCLSCFSYLVLPFIHFLVPSYILRKSNQQDPKIIAFARRVIRTQLYWKFTLWLLMLAILTYNLVMATYFEGKSLLNYLWPFLIMYFANAVIIVLNLLNVKNARFSTETNG